MKTKQVTPEEFSKIVEENKDLHGEYNYCPEILRAPRNQVIVKELLVGDTIYQTTLKL